MKLKNLTAIITGGSQGFGVEVARHFMREGANLMLCARDSEKLSAVIAELNQSYPANKAVGRQANVASLPDMEALADATIQEFGRIDILVANAGIYGTKGAIESVCSQEWSDAIDINLKGTVWQCRAVLPFMKKQGQGKIIILSGGGATRPMPYLSAYAASKAGVVRFAETLAEEVKNNQIDVNAVAPGALNTRLLDEILQAGPDKVGADFYAQAEKQKASGGTSLANGAELCVFLASQDSNGISGRLLSALWDPWKKLSELKSELQSSDVYTIRRIVPKDRGLDWDQGL